MERVAPQNELKLSACIAALDALRYTPAGIPALNLELTHESELEDQGHRRHIKLALKAVAFGTLAERLGVLPVGSCCSFQGFLGNHQARRIVFHVQAFSKI